MFPGTWITRFLICHAWLVVSAPSAVVMQPAACTSGERRWLDNEECQSWITGFIDSNKLQRVRPSSAPLPWLSEFDSWALNYSSTTSIEALPIYNKRPCKHKGDDMGPLDWVCQPEPIHGCIGCCEYCCELSKLSLGWMHCCEPRCDPAQQVISDTDYGIGVHDGP